MKDEKIGITCQEALDRMNDVGKALRRHYFGDSPNKAVELGIKSTTFNIDDIVKNTMDLAKPDWKILDVDNLPNKWYIEGKYDFEIYTESEWRKSSSKPTDKISNLIVDVFKYRYRLTPTKKTHEELAEEYFDGICEKEDNQHNGNLALYIIKDDVVKAYSDGRKSMESES